MIYGSVGMGAMAAAAAAWTRQQQLRRRGSGRPRLHSMCGRGLACGGGKSLRASRGSGALMVFLGVPGRQIDGQINLLIEALSGSRYPGYEVVHMHCPVRSLRLAEAPRCARIEIS
jgi:hypothetical protein